MPHDFIFNRDWYEHHDFEERLKEHQAEFAKLDGYDRDELVALLSSCDPREIISLPDRATNVQLKQILRFYIPLQKKELFALWAKQKEFARSTLPADMNVPDDERVEDAGLEHDEDLIIPPPPPKAKRRERVEA